ncbi:MAG TPA: hypothetical protein VH594_18745, partial [Trebonia sp.]
RLPAGRRPRRPRMPALLGWLISQPGPPRAAAVTPAPPPGIGRFDKPWRENPEIKIDSVGES